jgi:hypothetical protein
MPGFVCVSSIESSQIRVTESVGTRERKNSERRNRAGESQTTPGFALGGSLSAPPPAF